MNICITKLAYVLAITTLAGAAYAQTPAPEAAGRADKGVLEEVVVTAQRRAENVQDVPISIQAFSADALTQLGITKSIDLNVAVPGLTFTRSFIAAAPFIRGVGSDYSNIGGESPVAFYIDDVYRAAAAGGFFELGEVESIAVLKGPQGTLFGRNATGGVIMATTRDPGDSFAGNTKLEIGNYGRMAASVAVEGPLSENVSASLRAYDLSRDGYGKNETTGNDAFYNNNQYYEGKLKFEVGDNTTIRVGADWGREEIPVPYTWRKGVVNATTGTSLFCGDYCTSGDVDDNDDVTNYGVSFRVTHDLGGAEFRSITSYRAVQLRAYQDNDRTPSNTSNKRVYSNDEAYTQEFQLVSPASSEVSWIGGVFFLDSDAYYPGEQSWVSSPTAQTFSTLSQETSSYAIFGQATFPVTDADNLTVGIRYTVDDRTSKDFERQIATDGNLGPPTGGETTFGGEASEQWTSPTWKLAWDHAFTPDVMGFASYSRGFKSGLFNLIPFNPTPVHPETLDAFEVGFKSELLNSRLRLNASIFHYKYDEMQVTVQTLNPATGLTQSGIVNATSSTIDGFEFDFQWVVSDNFYIRGGFNYTDGTYDDFPNSPGFVPHPSGAGVQSAILDQTGAPLLRSPKTSYNIAPVFDIPTMSGTFSIYGNYSFKDKIYFDSGHINTHDATSIVNLGVDWADTEGTWLASVYVRNATDDMMYNKLSIGPPGPVSLPGNPRTYGVSVTRNFGAF